MVLGSLAQPSAVFGRALSCQTGGCYFEKWCSTGVVQQQLYRPKNNCCSCPTVHATTPFPSVRLANCSNQSDREEEMASRWKYPGMMLKQRALALEKPCIALCVKKCHGAAPARLNLHKLLLFKSWQCSCRQPGRHPGTPRPAAECH